LFEAAACGTPIITDLWPGVQDVFEPGREILVVERGEEVAALLDEVDDAQRLQIARAARARVLAGHTAAHRVDVLEREIRSAGLAAGTA
jgi:spore maturation protein CgeB